mmetsp:Transcript_18709/g.28402  ORF Transcript_18709/g.28402 Transcript_18709/m.28402 type:complete len:484 (-) Transcript_18709:297-1748(-)|eukprot:CAMPEP_0194075572 /NCGR_PEP_ID=MMETSP0149-20130528/2550_1 /TAXON_ID=122233 /ORGANISM="Chaetoceros debilis, Strain MM31A-1" /LENGTH=483 /DNA_ID=CAMNT_0038756089 /DNA_START=202 /DNA_END=1653 /DNA_ORIENTATION=+
MSSAEENTASDDKAKPIEEADKDASGRQANPPNDSDHDSLSEPQATLETTASSGASSPAVPQNRHEHDGENPEESNNQVLPTQLEESTRISWESGTAPVTSPSRVTVKLLVSNNMAGSIIGRSGQTISKLQSQSSSKIRLSQSGDYFPGTSDRICLIHGPLVNVKKGVALVLGKLYALQLELMAQLGHGQENDDSLAENETRSESINPVRINFTSRILIPSAACGMLIGREGGSIKKLKDNSGATSVRLSPKVTDHRTFERILTVAGTDLKSCVSFTESLLEGFVRHPEICRYLNSTTGYSRSSNCGYSIPRNAVLGFPTPTSGVSNMPRQTYPQSHQTNIHELEAGVQGLVFETQTGVQSPPRGHRQGPYPTGAPMHSMNAQVSSFHSNNQVIPQRTNQTSPPNTYGATMNLAVPDSMIGAILGRRGQTLMELQAESGARIKVSQRDEFVPGTNNRIITISGSQESIATARNLIRQLLSRNP